MESCKDGNDLKHLPAEIFVGGSLKIEGRRYMEYTGIVIEWSVGSIGRAMKEA